MSTIRKVTFTCTDRGQHRLTVLHRIEYHGEIPPAGVVVQWVPTVPGAWFDPGPCPRCRRSPRLSHQTMGRLLAELEPRTRDGQGRIELDISHLPI
jgi:hypothetical protein